MNEETREDSLVNAEDLTPSSAPRPKTGGTLLAEARLAQGMSLEDMAAVLKVSARKLQALEEDRYAELQGPTFVRALAQSACRVLKVDSKPILDLLPSAGAHSLESVNGGLNQRYQEHHLHHYHRSPLAGLRDALVEHRMSVIILFVLLMGAAAVRWWPADFGSVADWLPRHAVEGVESSKPAEIASASASAVVMGATNMVEMASAPADPRPFPAMAPLAPPVVESAGSSVAASAAVAVPLATPATVMQAAPAKPAAAASVPATPASRPVNIVLPAKAGHALLISAREPCWTEVLDGKGQPLFSRLLAAGESVGLDGAEPLRVKLGRANAAELWFKGRKIDLTSWTRDNLARVDLQ